MILNDRKVLMEIKDEAMRMRDITINPYWQRAWIQLADSADRLDGMLVRAQDREEEN